jgi:hypothetical protein
VRRRYGLVVTRTPGNKNRRSPLASLGSAGKRTGRRSVHTEIEWTDDELFYRSKGSPSSPSESMEDKTAREAGRRGDRRISSVRTLK